GWWKAYTGEGLRRFCGPDVQLVLTKREPVPVPCALRQAGADGAVQLDRASAIRSVLPLGGAKHVADQAEAPALVPEPVLQLGLLPFRAFPRCTRTRELRTVGRVQHAQRRPQQRRRRQGVTLGSLRQVDPAMIDRGNEVRLAARPE